MKIHHDNFWYTKKLTKLTILFKKTMSKSRKQIFKITQGILKRIYPKNLIWNENRIINFKNPQNF